MKKRKSFYVVIVILILGLAGWWLFGEPSRFPKPVVKLASTPPVASPASAPTSTVMIQSQLAAVLTPSAAAPVATAPPPPTATPLQPAPASVPSQPVKSSSESTVSAILPTEAPVTIANPQPKFADLSIRDRNAILGDIAKQDVTSIFQAFRDAGQIEHDRVKQDMLWRIMAGAMRQGTPPPEFFSQIKAFIEDGSNSNLERERMMAALALAATNESEDLLIYEATTLKDKEIKDSAVGSISNLGDTQDEDLAPALNQLWLQSRDQQILMSASLSMAKIGAPSSVQLLLSAALVPDSLDNTRKLIAKGALTTVISKNAVPPLAAALASQSPASPQAILAFKTLTQIPDATAAQTLIAWLQNADSSAAPLALTWISHASLDSQLKAATAALDPAVPFRSEANREALRAGLAAYKNSRTDVIREVNK